MGLVSPTQSNSGDTIEADDINTPINQLAAVINGNVDSNNLASSAVTTPKYTDGSITEAKHATGYLHGSDGYIDDDKTWVYVSATQFKVVGVDVTAQFPKGTKIVLNQTTDKYFYVVAAAFATDTTVTIVGDSSVPLANATITQPRYSYMASPRNFPQFLTSAPTTVGWAATPTIYSKFNINEGMVEWHLAITGTSNSATTTATLPVTAGTFTNGDLYASVRATDNGATTAFGMAQILSTGTLATFFKDAPGNTFAAANTKTISGVILRYPI